MKKQKYIIKSFYLIALMLGCIAFLTVFTDVVNVFDYNGILQTEWTGVEVIFGCKKSSKPNFGFSFANFLTWALVLIGILCAFFSLFKNKINYITGLSIFAFILAGIMFLHINNFINTNEMLKNGIHLYFWAVIASACSILAAIFQIIIIILIKKGEST